jgi:ATP-dependent helicase Lhr and Lhr-like helicase
VLASADPANAWGAILAWPGEAAAGGRRPARGVGSQVVLVNGALAAWAGRGLRQVQAWLPEVEPERSAVGEAVAGALAGLARSALRRGEAALVAEIDGGPPGPHPLAPFLLAAGFQPSALGFQLTRRSAAAGQGDVGPRA